MKQGTDFWLGSPSERAFMKMEQQAFSFNSAQIIHFDFCVCSFVNPVILSIRHEWYDKKILSANKLLCEI